MYYIKGKIILILIKYCRRSITFSKYSLTLGFGFLDK